MTSKPYSMTNPTELSDWSLDDLRAADALLEDLLKAAPLQPHDFETKFHQLLDDTRDKLEGYAHRVATGAMSAARFRQHMTSTLRAAHAAAFRNGASSVNGRTALSHKDHAAIAQRVADQLDYLERFAQAVRDAKDQDHAFSEAYTANRAGMYADALRATFWAGKQSRYDGTWQVWYDAEDDDHTCGPCDWAAAGSPYEVGLAPLPGSICDGGPRCRCTLRFERKPGLDGVAKGLTMPTEAEWTAVAKEHMCWGRPCGGAKSPFAGLSHLARLAPAFEPLAGKEKELRQGAGATMEWAESLSSSESNALENYRVWSEDVNGALRGIHRTGYADRPLTAKLADQVHRMDTAIDRSPGAAFDFAVFRSGWLPAGLKPGDTFTDDGFTSTTFSRDDAAKFPGKTFTVQVPKGTKFADMEAAQMARGGGRGEREILLGRGTTYEVVSGGEGYQTTVRVLGSKPAELQPVQEAPKPSNAQQLADIDAMDAQVRAAGTMTADQEKAWADFVAQAKAAFQ